MKFSEMPYTRPNVAQTVERYRDMARRARAAASGKELVDLFRLHNQLDDGFATAYRLAQIRHTLDTRDEFYDAENDFFDQAAPEVGNAQLEFYRAVLASPHKAALAEAYAPILLDKMELAVSAASDEVLELMQQENALASRYQKIKAGAQVAFDGKTLTLPGLDPYKQSLDRAARKAAFEAEGGFYDRNREELDDIYTRMIENRNAQARKLGYDSYVDLSYKRMGRLGYGPKEVASFREQVAKYVTPLAHESMKAQFARTGMADAKFYDTTVSFADGNPTPVGTADELLAKAVQMYTELSPETARFIRFMNESELFDLVSRPGKATGGYCETIPAYGAPFVFSNFNGTSGDVDVLTHEAGHAFADFIASQTVAVRALSCPTMEGAETHSMSMEFLTAPWHHLFFGELTDKYELSHAEDALLFIPYGCLVDHFQEEVYRHPEMTPEERNQKWLELEGRYRPYINFDGLPFYGRGAGWQRQLHIYLYPFYYIDYCMAQVMSLQFYALSLEDREKAWEKYMAFVRQGGTKTFVDLAHSVDLRSPIDQGCVKDVCQAAFQWTEGHLVE